MCRLVVAQTSFYGIKKTRTHRANHREMAHCSKKILVSRNELRETENIGAIDLDEFQVREFLFLNKQLYYPTALRRVQITPKTSTNITRYLYSRGPVRQVFLQRASDELD